MSKQQESLHWTAASAEDFRHSIAAEFIRFVEDAMEAEHVTQSELAERLGVTKGRVSQVLNNPGNLTLDKIVEYVRALHKKVAIVGYDDGDRENRRGLVSADLFRKCWEHMGSPADFFTFAESCVAITKPTTVLLFQIVGPGSSVTSDAQGPSPWKSAVEVETHAITN